MGSSQLWHIWNINSHHICSENGNLLLLMNTFCVSGANGWENGENRLYGRFQVENSWLGQVCEKSGPFITFSLGCQGRIYFRKFNPLLLFANLSLHQQKSGQNTVKEVVWAQNKAHLWTQHPLKTSVDTLFTTYYRCFISYKQITIVNN